jgi:hypothetical protein
VAPLQERSRLPWRLPLKSVAPRSPTVVPRPGRRMLRRCRPATWDYRGFPIFWVKSRRMASPCCFICSGLLPGLAVVALGIIGLIMNLGVYGVLLSLLMILLSIVIAVLGWIVAVLAAVVDDIKKLPAIGFGISSGRGESESDLALTPWLYRRLQRLASKSMDQPLTIGDLKQHGVDFQAMTHEPERCRATGHAIEQRHLFLQARRVQEAFRRRRRHRNGRQPATIAQCAGRTARPGGAASARPAQATLSEAGVVAGDRRATRMTTDPIDPNTMVRNAPF